MLADEIEQLNASPSTSIVYPGSVGLIDDVTGDPAAFGFTNASSPAFNQLLARLWLIRTSTLSGTNTTIRPRRSIVSLASVPYRLWLPFLNATALALGTIATLLVLATSQRLAQ